MMRSALVLVCVLVAWAASCSSEESEGTAGLDASGINGSDDALRGEPRDTGPEPGLDASVDAPVSVDERADAQAMDSGRDAQVTGDVMLVQSGTFNSGVKPCGLAFDHVANQVWVHACNGATVLRFAPDGTPQGSVPRRGESADDVDVEIAPKALSLGAASIAEGDLLFINGETGVAEIHLLAKDGTARTETLTTAFGNSHVVGGGFHSNRGTWFLVQDRVPGATLGNRVAELDAATGAVLNSFSLASAVGGWARQKVYRRLVYRA